MPEGAFTGDRIGDPEAIAPALRRLLDGMGTKVQGVVFGLATGNVVTQVMGIPHVPENELNALLEGELEHYKIVREGEGAFDYARLNANATTPASSTTGTVEAAEAQMLLMATEKSVVSAYRRVAELAGLRLIGLEPTLLAMCRIGWMFGSDPTGALCLSVAAGRSEIAIIEPDAVRLYRRIEVGSDSLFPSSEDATSTSAPAPNATRPHNALLNDEADKEDEEAGTPHPATMGTAGIVRPLNTTAARTLALEVRRSLEYYRREHSKGGENRSPLSKIVLITDLPDAEVLLQWLREELGTSIRLASPSALLAPEPLPIPYRAPGLQEIPDSSKSLDTIEGDTVTSEELSLLAALGLALGIMTGTSHPVPHFDLSSEQIAYAEITRARRALAFSLAGSIVLLLIGAGLTLAVGDRANNVSHHLEHMQDDLAELQEQQQMVFSRVQAQQQELATLRKRGYPMPRLLDAITKVLPAQASLTEADLDKEGRLTITGNAVNDRAMVQTLEGLRTIPWFDVPSLDNFARKPKTDFAPSYVEFKLQTHINGGQSTP